MGNLKLIKVFCLVIFSLSLTSPYQNAEEDHGIETYSYDSFPKDKVALHMPCEESNIFATKCMCHIKCTDKTCANALRLCVKYKDSKYAH